MPYRQGPATCTKAEHEIRKMLDKIVIEPATSEWASTIVLVTNRGGLRRFCVDYQRLNSETIPDAHPLPHIYDCLETH